MNRRFIATVVLVMMALVAAGCRPRPAAPNPTATPTYRVLVLGDSNLVASSVEVETALRNASFQPDVRGVIRLGVKDTDFWLLTISRSLRARPTVVVIALGANDAVNSADVFAFDGRLDLLMRGIGNRPVVWLTHHEGRPEPYGTNAVAINAAIRAAPGRWPNLTVVDLAPELAADPSLLMDDALHFTPAGIARFAARITEGASARVRPGG